MKKNSSPIFLFTIFIIVAALSTAFLVVINGYRENTACKKQLTESRQTAHDQLIKSETQTAVSMLQSIYDGYKVGWYSLDKAKQFGAEVLRDMRYGDNQEGYFFADTTEGVNVVLYGRSDVEGINRNDAQDVNGLFYIQEIRKNGLLPGGGYTDYWYPKIEQTETKAKRAYSLFFEPFGWIVGTGYYLEDIK